MGAANPCPGELRRTRDTRSGACLTPVVKSWETESARKCRTNSCPYSPLCTMVVSKSLFTPRSSRYRSNRQLAHLAKVKLVYRSGVIHLLAHHCGSCRGTGAVQGSLAIWSASEFARILSAFDGTCALGVQETQLAQAGTRCSREAVAERLGVGGCHVRLAADTSIWRCGAAMVFPKRFRPPRCGRGTTVTFSPP